MEKMNSGASHTNASSELKISPISVQATIPKTSQSHHNFLLKSLLSNRAAVTSYHHHQTRLAIAALSIHYMVYGHGLNKPFLHQKGNNYTA